MFKLLTIKRWADFVSLGKSLSSTFSVSGLCVKLVKPVDGCNFIILLCTDVKQSDSTLHLKANLRVFLNIKRQLHEWFEFSQKLFFPIYFNFINLVNLSKWRHNVRRHITVFMQFPIKWLHNFLFQYYCLCCITNNNSLSPAWDRGGYLDGLTGFSCPTLPWTWS